MVLRHDIVVTEILSDGSLFFLSSETKSWENLFSIFFHPVNFFIVLITTRDCHLLQ